MIDTATAALIAAVISILVYSVKKLIDWKVKKALETQLELYKRIHIERFDIVRKLGGMMAEISHCINHLEKEDCNPSDLESYNSRCREFCMKSRSEARANILLLGADYVDKLTDVTDFALKSLNETSKIDMERWLKMVKKFINSSEKALRELQL